MSGVSKIEIHEAAEDLLQLMKQQKQLRQRVRLQALYLLKSGEVASISHAWAMTAPPCSVGSCASNRQLGLSGLLTMAHRGGRHAAIPPWAQAKLKVRLEQPRGFATYGQIVTWLASECGICVNYWGATTLESPVEVIAPQSCPAGH
ncbi:MAG: helix-turn-helix domain-containing protein [Leptolyngbya sp. SIO1D8]|nr:helix-turn-helix domain-containing protein [Leptolyngbya sp. SIO1D8]